MNDKLREKEIQSLRLILDRWFHCADGNMHLLAESQRHVLAMQIYDAGYRLLPQAEPAPEDLIKQVISDLKQIIAEADKDGITDFGLECYAHDLISLIRKPIEQEAQDD